MSWRKVVALGGVASAIAIGCTVTVTDGTPDGGPDEETGGSGGSSGKDAGTGGSKATGGSAGKATGGTGGSSTGGKGGTGGSSTGGKGGTDSGSGGATVCMPDKDAPCDYCIETKCCAEWLDCVNNAPCQEEFECIQRCMINDGGNFPDIMDCAGSCKMDAVGIASETSALVGCMRDTPSDGSTTQNCTNECFGRDL